MGGDLKAYAAFCRLMADENRLRILFSLQGGRKSVSSVIEATELSQTLVSYHLRNLREKGLVKTERKGPFVLYSLTNEDVLAWVSEAEHFLAAQGLCRSRENHAAPNGCCDTVQNANEPQ